jgi:hypothetical protein
MRFAPMALGVVSLCAGLACTKVQAAVSESDFPPKTTADLIALCSATKDDPLMTAALNYCHGFAEGAVQVALGYEAVTRPSRAPFCLPSPPPTHDEAMARFSAWAKADPTRMDEAAIVGLLSYLTETYPCPHPAVAAHRKTGSPSKKAPHA